MENKITNIEVQKRNKNRVNIYIDEEYRFSCDSEIIYKYNLSKGQNIHLKDLEEIINEDNYLKAKAAAFRIIERSYKTEKEMEDKLLLKGFDKDIVERIKKLLKEYDFMNDAKYVQAFIKDNIKSQGNKKLQYNLAKKGVSESLIKQELGKINKEDMEKYAASLAEKKYRALSKRESDPWKLSNKLISFLLSKGYDYEMSKSIVGKITNISQYE